MANDKIVIKGAREHNLKNVNLTLPREKLIVMTGLSGSGKSSLAFDTIYADGQRRYVESLSSYARMFLGRMDKPDVDEITGLSPAISIDQKTTSHNPRSTVGTVTEIYDYLRLLYARVGVPHCPVCGRVISQQTVDEMVDAVLKLDEGTKFQVLAPVVRQRKGTQQKELDDARALIEDAMAAGAPGVSLGIMYLPECYSSTDEFAYILEPVGRYHRVITTHIRGEGDSMVQSVREVIEIARRVGCALEISHFKSCGMKNWGKDIHTAIADIEAARAEGMDVTVDFYPYEGGSTALTTMLPPVFVAGNMTRALEKLGTPEGVEEFRRTSSVLYDDWDNFCITLGWDRIIISGVVRPENEKFLGMRVTEAAEKFGFEDAAALAAYLMHSEDGKTAIINMSMSQDDIDTVARLPWSNIISDAIYAKTDTPHPRMFGAFPKVLREYVAERGIYTMQEAIRRMTSQPAARMGLVGRGSLQKGNYADILVFDPKKFTDHATFTNPAQKATGLDWCIVNGQVAIDHDRRTTTGAGMVLTV